MPDCEFSRVAVYHMSNGGTQIQWALDRYFFFKGRAWFFIDFGHPGTDDWVALNPNPIVDDCFFFDDCKRHWGTMIRHYYRVRLVLPDEEGCPVYKSQPERASGALERRDWLQLREMVRKEYLQQRKQGGTGEGTPGFLLKRKQFGLECQNPDCLDHDTREITNSNCGRCYGTGIDGGYYAGIEFWMTLDANWTRRISVADPPRGTNSDIIKGARAILYPILDTKDIWIREDNDARYVIDKLEVAAQFKGIPFVAKAQLNLAPATDIIYSVPVDGTPQSSSSESSESSESGAPEVACDVTRGLDPDTPFEDW